MVGVYSGEGCCCTMCKSLLMRSVVSKKARSEVKTLALATARVYDTAAKPKSLYSQLAYLPVNLTYHRQNNTSPNQVLEMTIAPSIGIN